MATVTFDRATHVYPGAIRPAVDELSLEIKDGEFLVLVGPSGCGKTTALRMVAGLEEVDSGRILIGERDVTDLAPKERDVAMVFQNYALYPYMTVAENMGFALRIAGEPKSKIREHVAEAAKLLDLERFLERKPKALSGGERQRVAMGRAIVRHPHVFLMDEPLSNLDAKLRVSTRTQLASLQHRLGITTLYVTHDQIEAMTMGDRVAVIKEGILQQVGTPLNLYDDPDNVFVAGFMGSPAMNLFTVNSATALDLFGVADRDIDGSSRPDGQIAGRVIVGLRPEDVELVGNGSGLRTTVDLVEDLGTTAYLHGTALVEGAPQPLVARLSAPFPTKGEVVSVAAKPGRVYLFSAEDGTRRQFRRASTLQIA